MNTHVSPLLRVPGCHLFRKQHPKRQQYVQEYRHGNCQRNHSHDFKPFRRRALCLSFHVFHHKPPDALLPYAKVKSTHNNIDQRDNHLHRIDIPCRMLDNLRQPERLFVLILLRPLLDILPVQFQYRRAETVKKHVNKNQYHE